MCYKTTFAHICLTRTCTDFSAFDLAKLVTDPPAQWVGLKTLGAAMGGDQAALRHPGLTQFREKFDFIQPVESGTYNPPIEASLLLAPSNLLHFATPSKAEDSLAPPLDLSSFMPGDRLAVMQTTMIKQFNKVVIQPWAESDSALGQVVQTFLKSVEGDKQMQERCKANPPLLKPRPGLLCVAKSGEGVNRRWCRAKVGDCFWRKYTYLKSCAGNYMYKILVGLFWTIYPGGCLHRRKYHSCIPGLGWWGDHLRQSKGWPTFPSEILIDLMW